MFYFEAPHTEVDGYPLPKAIRLAVRPLNQRLPANRASAVMNIGGGKENQFGTSSKDAVLKLNTWHHLAMTYDGQELKLFFDEKPAGPHKNIDALLLPV